MKNLLYKFMHEEDGAELIEIAIGIGIVALLAIGAWSVAQNAQGTLEAAGDKIGQITDDINQGMHSGGQQPVPSPDASGIGGGGAGGTSVR